VMNMHDAFDFQQVDQEWKVREFKTLDQKMKQ